MWCATRRRGGRRRRRGEGTRARRRDAHSGRRARVERTSNGRHSVRRSVARLEDAARGDRIPLDLGIRVDLGRSRLTRASRSARLEAESRLASPLAGGRRRFRARLLERSRPRANAKKGDARRPSFDRARARTSTRASRVSVRRTFTMVRLQTAVSISSASFHPARFPASSITPLGRPGNPARSGRGMIRGCSPRRAFESHRPASAAAPRPPWALLDHFHTFQKLICGCIHAKRARC